jgi:hypothetical protein
MVPLLVHKPQDLGQGPVEAGLLPNLSLGDACLLAQGMRKEGGGRSGGVNKQLGLKS